MRTRVWWLIGLMVALLGSGFAQTLVLTNGDVNGDNVVDDADLLEVQFNFGNSTTAPADLNGDGIVDDADLLIVLFNFGAQGAPTFAGQVQSPQGAFSVSLTVRLRDWVGSAQPVKVQLKPVGRESDATVPIFEYSASVGGTDTTVPLDNLPAGACTVRAFAVASGRWLRTQGRIVTEVPWIFAAPTGANKVTVYWDGVPGATGYRVRWGTTSGSYPNSSAVLPATARQHTVVGLDSEREYYFVVEAAYDGLWGPPSEEDSAVPHEGAIRWDSGNVSWIMEDVRRVIGSTAGPGMLDVLGPDGLIYSDSGVSLPTTFFDVDRQVFILEGFPGFEIPVVDAGREALENTCTGPYRRVRTRGDRNIIAVGGTFWVPSTRSPRPPYLQIYIPPGVDNQADPRRTADTPFMYFGLAFRDVDVEGGLMYHREGRGDVYYPRWQAYLKVVHKNKKEPSPAITDTRNMRGHILDDDGAGGTPTRVELYTNGWERLVWLRVMPMDPVFGERIFLREIAATAKLGRDISGARFRRVFSIAQRREAMGNCSHQPGYRRTGSFVIRMAVGYNPIEGSFLDPPAQVGRSPLLWYDWTEFYTDQAGAYPSTGIVSWIEIERFSREVVSISL